MDSAPVDEAPAQHLLTAALADKYVLFVNKMVDDEGGGADRDLSSWRPHLPNDWFYLGQGPASGWNSVLLA
ncbi:hypothetical protein BDZ89DRAFT_1134245 [Hymenopellis radicata]|nr:hypothetical protein BDZ89DRAFT_1134245 [Hymenopellis radicata]